MLSATLYRYVATLRRNPVDTVSMFARVGVSALLYVVFALFYLPDAGGAGYLCASLAVVNLVINASCGAGYEGGQDAADERIDTVVLAPGGLPAFAWSQALVQTGVALAQSAVVLAVAALALPGSLAPTGARLPWAVAGLASLLLIAVPWAALCAWAAIRTDRFVQVNFATSLAVTLAGAFWPIEALPAPFGAIARVNPLTYAIDLARSSLTGTPPLLDPATELAVACGLGAVLVAVALATMRRQGDLSNQGRI